MESTTINQIALAVFLGANLALGLWAGRGVKTVRDYVLANQSLALGVLSVTLIVTLLDAGNIGLSTAYTRGLASLLQTLCLSIVALLLGYLVFPKLLAFTDCCTLTEVMGVLYGPVGYYFTLVVSTLFSLLIIISQLTTLRQISGMAGISDKALVVSIGILITLYAAKDGIRSVAATDILQFVFIGAGFLSVGLIALVGFGEDTSVLKRYPEHLLFISYKSIVGRLMPVFFWSIWPTFLLSPPVIQRVLMARNDTQVRHMFLSFAFIYPVFRVLMVIVGFKLLFLVKSPSFPGGLGLGNMIEHLTNHAVPRMLFFLAVCSVILSTADSFLHSLAVQLSHAINQLIHKEASDRSAFFIWQTRIASVALGIACTGGAFLCLEVKLGTLMRIAYMLFSSIALPFIAGVCGMVGSKKTFLSSILTFFISFLSLLLLPAPYYERILNFIQIKVITASPYENYAMLACLVSLLMSGIVFFIAHYLEYGRFIIVQRQQDRWSVRRSYQVSLFASLLWRNPAAWATEKVATYGREPELLGLLLYGTFLLPPPTHTAGVLFLVGCLRGAGFVLCTLLLIESLWPKSAARYFNLFYLATIFYCVPFLNAVVAFSAPQSFFALCSLVLSMVLLAVLVDWKTFILFEMAGTSLAFLVGRLWQTDQVDEMQQGGGGVLMYTLAYTFLIAFLFIRKKASAAMRRCTRLEAERAQHTSYIDDYLSLHQQLAAASHPQSSMMAVIAGAAQKLQDIAGRCPDAAGELSLVRTAIQHAATHLQQVANKSYEHLPLHTQKIAVADLLNEVHHALKSYGIDPGEQVILQQHTTLEQVVCDPVYITELLVNAIRYLAEQQPRQKVTFAVEEVPFNYHLPPDSKPAVPVALRFVVTTSQAAIPPAQPLYTLHQEAALALPSAHLLLARNQQIIRAHYGLAYLTEGEEGSLQEYILPALVHLLRPKIPYFAEEDLLEEARPDLPEEQAFLEKLRQKANFSHQEIDRVIWAMKRAKYHHRHQPRASGEPYYIHPLAVADIALDYTTHLPTIIAALLHDVVEDTSYTLSQMAAEFGEEVTTLVSLVSQLYNSDLRKVKVSEADSHAAMFRSEDEQACLIKLCDRLHNMRTLGAMPPDKQVAKAADTKDHFVSLAGRMGLKEMAQELEELADRVLEQLG